MNRGEGWTSALEIAVDVGSVNNCRRNEIAPVTDDVGIFNFIAISDLAASFFVDSLIEMFHIGIVGH